MRIITWPFRMIFSLTGFILNLVGRMVCAIIGIALLIVGFVLTSTIVALFIGIPLMILGLLFFVRAIF